MANLSGIKYTAVLPYDLMAELKKLSEQKIIPSVNYGIKCAVQAYLEQNKKELYEKYMREAAQDKSFLERTLKVQTDFESADCEVSGEW